MSSHRDREERKSKKRHRDDADRKERKKSGKREKKLKIVDDDGSEDEYEWAEKAPVASTSGSNVEGSEPFIPPSISSIPTSAANALTSSSAPSTVPPYLPHSTHSVSKITDSMLDEAPISVPVEMDGRHEVDGGTFAVGSMPSKRSRPWEMEKEDYTGGYGEGDVGSSTAEGGKGMFGIGDFGDLGRERKKKEKGLAPAPEEMLGKSTRELNRDYWRKGEIPSATKDGNGGSGASTPVAGSAGSSWRITKLKRLYEAHEDDPSIPLEELAIDRFGSMEAFRAVEEEKRIVDAREDRRSERRGGAGGGKGSYFSSEPGGGSRMGPRYSFEGGSGMRSSSFRKPGESPLATPTPSGAQSRQASKPSTPVPSVFTPTQATLAAVSRQSSKLAAVDTMSSATMETMTRPVLDSGSKKMTQSELNKLQAKILRAKLVDPEGKKVKELEKEYEDALAVGVREEMPGELENGGKEVRVLPTLDGRGRLYDVGTGQGGEDGEGAEDKRARKKRKREEEKFETRDMKTGEVLRYNKDDDSMTLEELVRQERFGGGAADQKNLDSELASRITKDGKFEDDLDYMDDNADRLARKKMKTDAMKRRFAVQDFARTKKALENCSFCYGDDGVTLPKAGMVALGTRAYLAVTEFEELTEGHCIIVPLQHHLNMLEADDETWEEVKNFMKTLMQMFASQDKGVIFFETVISFKQQRHTFVECIPVPWSLYDDSPAYFKEAIVTSEEEWSQHKKLIDFEKRGWRRSMVATLPYFAVWWDYKANKGYGHVIEGVDGPEGGGDGYEDNEQRSGGGEFPRYFATEIIGNMLELEPRRWRKPRRIDRSRNPERVKAFQKMYDSFNWTKMLKEE